MNCFQIKNYKQMIETLISVLKVMGYNPIHDEEKKNIHFFSFGFENFNKHEKNIIRAIMGNSLSEFFYGHNTQYIYYHEQSA